MWQSDMPGRPVMSWPAMAAVATRSVDERGLLLAERHGLNAAKDQRMTVANENVLDAKAPGTRTV
jgi:hypothetical protein